MAGGERLRLVRRLAALVFVAQRRRYMPTLKELAREHRCSERTIRRDLEAIEAVMPVRWRQEIAS